MKNPLYIEEQSLGNEELESIRSVFESTWLSHGKMVRRFEEKLKVRYGFENAVAVSSCSVGTELLLKMLAGDEKKIKVALPSLNYYSCINSVINAGFEPIIVDVDFDTLNLSPAKLHAIMDDDIRFIIPIHYSGIPADLDELKLITSQYDCLIVEDAAHALHSKYKGRFIGDHGNPTCFSFDSHKYITTGEGGAITWSNASIDNHKIRSIICYGVDYKEVSSAFELLKILNKQQAAHVGTNYKMSDINAAVGVAQLEKIDDFYRRRKDIGNTYVNVLSPLESEGMIRIFSRDTNDKQINYYLFVLWIDFSKLTIPKEEFLEELYIEGIGVGVHYFPLHKHTIYQQYRVEGETYEHTERLYNGVLDLPISAKMYPEDAVFVAQKLKHLILSNIK